MGSAEFRGALCRECACPICGGWRTPVPAPDWGVYALECLACRLDGFACHEHETRLEPEVLRGERG